MKKNQQKKKICGVVADVFRFCFLRTFWCFLTVTVGIVLTLSTLLATKKTVVVAGVGTQSVKVGRSNVGGMNTESLNTACS